MHALTRIAALFLAVAMLVLSGCASTPRNPDDPLERYNRAMFSFNDGVDRALVRPAAQVYETVTPRFVRTGVGNFFGNIADVWIGLNNMLQGKVGDGMSDWMRFMVNSTFGIFGLFDVASEMGLPKNDEDFGQTLAVWGVGEGPYVVLPLLGPRTLRDAAALPVDMKGDPVASLDHGQTRAAFAVLRVVHGRAKLLPLDATLEDALDKYAFVRDSYLQRRRFLVHDGNPPLEYEDFNGEYEDDNGHSSLLPVRTMSDAVAEMAIDSLELVTLVEADAVQSGFAIR